MADFGIDDYTDLLGWSHSGCKGFGYYRRILGLAQPKYGTARQRQKNIHKIFYPVSDIQAILGETNALEEIIGCTCEGCIQYPGSSGFNQLEVGLLVKSITNKTRPRYILLAILLCMGQSYIIRYLDDRFCDLTLDNITNPTVLPPSALQRIIPPDLTVDEFIDRFQMLRPRFDLRTFKTWEDGQQPEFSPDDIFPFVFDDLHSDNSGYGIVRRFQLHEAYNKILDKNGQKVTDFARKILKAEITEEEFKIERDNLAFVNSLNSPNIIEMFCWYTTAREGNRKEYTYVFPFMDASLQDILIGKPTVPPELTFREPTTLFSSHLWQQMIDVTSAVYDIHNPDPEVLRMNGLDPGPGRWVGYHFDLKPSNILADRQGRLLVTDFGLSVFKRRGGGEDASGTAADNTVLPFGPLGTLAYQPPPTSLQTLPGILPPGEPAFDIPKLHRAYDVWSLACVMTEVITFVVGYNDCFGPDAVKSFTTRRAEDSIYDQSTTWHYSSHQTGNRPDLKPSVYEWFEKMRTEAEDGNPYLNSILDLLEEMFVIDSRIDSEAVLGRLKNANLQEQERLDGLAGITRFSSLPELPEFSIPDWIRGRGLEQRVYDSQKKARHQILFRDYLAERNSQIASRMSLSVKLGDWVTVSGLSVFNSERREPRIRIAMIMMEQQRQVAESESSSRVSELYIPLYRFKEWNKDWVNSLSFRGLFSDRVITFESRNDLYELQTAILGYRRKNDFSMELSDCLTSDDSASLSPKNKSPILEIWTTRPFVPSPAASGYSASGSSPPSRRPSVAHPPPTPVGESQVLFGTSPPNSSALKRSTPSITSVAPQLRPTPPRANLFGIIKGGEAVASETLESPQKIRAPEAPKLDSVVIVFRPHERDIIIVPILHQMTELRNGDPTNFRDPKTQSLTFIPKRGNHFRVVSLKGVPDSRADPLSPQDIVPGIPLNVQAVIERAKDDVDRQVIVNRSSLVLKFKDIQEKNSFVQNFARAFPWSSAFHAASYNAFVQAGVIRPRPPHNG